MRPGTNGYETRHTLCNSANSFFDPAIRFAILLHLTSNTFLSKAIAVMIVNDMTLF